MSDKAKVRIPTELLIAPGNTALVRVELLQPGTTDLIPNCLAQGTPTSPEFVAEFDVPAGTQCDVRYQGLTSSGNTTVGPFVIPGATAQVVPTPPAG